MTRRYQVAAQVEEVRDGGVDTEDLLAKLAWGLIRDWRRRDVDPTTRRAWVRLYVGVIRQARRGRVVH